MAVTWLHISDFHFKDGDPYDRDVVLRALVKAVAHYRTQGWQPDLIFATGDIAQSGKDSEYRLATAFFNALLEAAGLGRERLFVVPGNHDVDRKAGKFLARTLSTREEADEYFGPGEPKHHITMKQAGFSRWHDAYFGGARRFPTETTCGPVTTLEISGLKLAILPINSAVFCQDDADDEKLWIGRRCLDEAVEALGKATPDVTIALMHHPLDWLNQIERANVKSMLQTQHLILLRGHLHEADIEDSAGIAGSILHIAAGAAYQTRKWPNRAFFARTDGQAVTLFPLSYQDSPLEAWTVDPSLFPHDPHYMGTFRLPRPATTSGPIIATPPPPASAKQVRTNITPLHGPFVGREGLMQTLAGHLADRSNPAVIQLHGEPGVGKSELAREYARRHRDLYPGGCLFIDAGLSGPPIGLITLGRSVLGLAVPGDLPLEEQCLAALSRLGDAPVLIIYDNALSADAIRPWLPPAGIAAHVVVTSVGDFWNTGWPTIHVQKLPRDSALDLVAKIADAETARRFGDRLVDTAGGLPVQLVPATHALVHSRRRGRTSSDAAALVPETAASFRNTYDRLDSPLQLLLHATLRLNPQRIDRAALRTQMAGDGDWNDKMFDRQLDACLDLHLLDGEATLRMHQLFAEYLRSIPLAAALLAPLRAVQKIQQRNFSAVAEAVADHPNQAEAVARLLCFRLAPADWVDGTDLFPIGDGERIGLALIEIGQFAEARPWYERAVEATEKGDVHGRIDQESLSGSLHCVGYCHAGAGQFEAARPWFERAVDAKEKGDPHGRVDHESLGSSLHGVGWCYAGTGHFEAARPWFERAVEAKEKGDLHGRVDRHSLGSSLHCVGSCNASARQFEAARPWYERAVEASEKGDVHGRVDHENRGSGLHEVGHCYASTGQFEAARPWLERAVDAKEKGDVHGRVDHQSLGSSLHRVGHCYASTGQFEAARPWCERAVEAAQKGDRFGRVDAETLGILARSLAQCLRNLGQEAEAEALRRRMPECFPDE